MTEMICSSSISCNAGQPDSCHPSGRGSPNSGSIQDADSMLPDLMVQSSSKADLSPNPLVTETSTPPEEPFTGHEMSQELDDEALKLAVIVRSSCYHQMILYQAVNTQRVMESLLR